MSNLTANQINTMTPPQLRKAVSDLGGEPLKINKGNPADLKKWLLHKTKNVPAVAAKATVKPTMKVATPPKPAAKAPVKAAPSKPSAAPAKPAPKPVAKPAAPVSNKPAPAAQAATKESKEAQSWQETIELRLATIEAQLGIAATTMAAEPADDLSSLDKFLVTEEGANGPEQYHAIDVADVATLNEEQLRACGLLLGKPFKDGTPVRAMRNEVTVALQKLAGQTVAEGTPEAGVEEEASTGEEEAAGEGLVEYEVGNIVQAMYGEELFDPCRIEKVFRKKADNSLSGYDVFFKADNTVARLEPEAVVGLSELTIEEETAE